VTLTEIIERAENVAAADLDPRFLQTVDAESHVPSAFALLARQYAAEGKVSLLARSSKTLAFTDGIATVSDDVLQSCLHSSTLTDTSDNTKMYAFVPEWDDFVNAPSVDVRLGYYTLSAQGSMAVIEPEEEYEAGEGLTGSLNLRTPCVWAVPASPATNVAVSAEVAGDMINMIAASVRGELIQKGAVEATA
jgi:hypothetical protein